MYHLWCICTFLSGTIQVNNNRIAFTLKWAMCVHFYVGFVLLLNPNNLRGCETQADDGDVVKARQPY